MTSCINGTSSSLVTIAIPAYKATFLKEAIQSALSQTYQRIELIIINDCSPEPIDQIVSKFQDSRIRYIKNTKNIGFEDPSKNWNKCLSLANGDFFAILCDDDKYEPTFIEEMLSLRRQHPSVKIFRSRVKIIDEKNKVTDLYPASPELENCFDYVWHRIKYLRQNTISEFFYDTHYIKQMGGFEEMPKAWGSDDLSFFKFSLECGIATSNKLLVSYRLSDICISATNGKYTKEKVNAHFIYKEKLQQLLIKCNDENLRALIKESYPKFFYDQIMIPLTHSCIKDLFKILFFEKKIPLFWKAKFLLLNICTRISHLIPLLKIK